MTSKRMAGFVSRRMNIILWSVILTTTVIIGGSYLIRPTYRSTSKILVPRENAEEAISAEFKTASHAQKSAEHAAHGTLSAGLITSRSYLDEMVFKLQIREKDGDLMPADKLFRSDSISEALGLLMSRPSVKIGPLESGGLLEVKATAADPHESMMMANTLAEIITEEKKKERESEFSQIRTKVEERLDQIKADYQSNIQKIADIQKREESVDLETEVRLAAEKMARLLNEKEDTVTALAQAKAEVIHLNRELSKEQPGALSASALKAHPQIEDLKRRLTTLGLSLAEASAELTAEHPKIIALKEQIATAEQELKSEIAAFRTSAPQLAQLQRQVAALEARRKSVDSSLDEHMKRVSELPDKTLKQASFDMPLETAPKHYSAFLDSLHKLSVAEVAGIAAIKVVDSAPLPSAPVFPKRGPAALFGLLAGLMLGLVLALAKEYLDDTIRSAQDVEVLSPAVLIGAVPKFETAEICLISDRDSNDPLHESYRWLRTNFQLAGDLRHRDARSLLVTSAGPEEGKTTTVANLGISLARDGKRVILVDTDLRRPNLHRYFGLSNDVGLVDVLEGQRKLEDVVQMSTVTGLSVLASGAPCPDPGTLLESNQMAAIISALQSRYDVLILDTAPLLVKIDALNMARYVNHSVVVVESECTTRSAFMDMMGSLTKVHGKPLGVVLNKCPRGRKGNIYNQYGYVGQRKDYLSDGDRESKVSLSLPEGVQDI